MEDIRSHRPGGRFIAGDPLRGLACMFVVAFHLYAAATDRFFNAGDPTAYTDFGEAAWVLLRADTSVWVFFVLSAYLLALPFVRAIVDDRPWPSVGTYFRNRALRVLPCFWLVAAGVLVFQGGLDAGAEQVLMLLTLLGSYGEAFVRGPFEQSWTVGTEFAFYLALPALSFAIWRAGARGRRGAAVLTVLLAGVFVGSLALRSATSDIADLRTFPPLAFAFVPGLLLALIHVLWRERLVGEQTRRAALGLLVLSVVAFVGSTRLRTDSQVVVGLALTVSSATLVAACLLWQWSTGRAWRVLDNRVGHWLGTRSFPIYLVHVPLVWELGPVIDRGSSAPEGFALAMVPLLAGTLALAEVLHRFVEVPAMRLARNWRRGREERSDDPAPERPPVSVAA